jgi:UDP-N-acetylglucosamine--N-acetylmuramyl-(pentapeptide) pyrophosphoryl-undecaprenol N-acetylglucosamine transferase
MFAAGGTGGHLYPAIALADALAHRASVRFIGTGDRLETSIVPQAGYELETISSLPLERRVSIAALRTAGANVLGITQAMRAVARFSPDIIIATGGYVCFPVMAAASMLRVARRTSAGLALLEPNVQPGLTNRLLAPLVDEVWGAFAHPPRSFASKYLQTGIPVRASVVRGTDRLEAARRLNLDPSRRTILALGGSQGARSINEAVAALITRRSLPGQWQVLHVSGPRDYEYMQAEERAPFGDNHVVLVPYLTDMADAYTLADVVIARAGASTLGELSALGLPSILVPYPFAADDHQLRNAREFERAGASIVIEDRALSADALWWGLRSLMEAQRLSVAGKAARSLAAVDPVATILTRIDSIVSRKDARA